MFHPFPFLSELGTDPNLLLHFPESPLTSPSHSVSGSLFSSDGKYLQYSQHVHRPTPQRHCCINSQRSNASGNETEENSAQEDGSKLMSVCRSRSPESGERQPYAWT
ncbi:hypothetical protein Q8A73_011104 [Channa argus]|nr:hypothetical protein Q8A73_011104 [Channa argus]